MRNKSATLIGSILLTVATVCAAAGEELNVIVASDWSKPVALQNDELHMQSVRGRLLIVEGYQPAYGGPRNEPQAMTFVELQNVTEAMDNKGIDVCFDVMKLKCDLADKDGRMFPKPAMVAWSGRGPFSPCWVSLPYNSTIRLFVNSGSRNPLMIFQNGEPWNRWSIPANDTNEYFLSGTLTVFTRTNASILSMTGPFAEMRDRRYNEECVGTLVFPRTHIPKPPQVAQNEKAPAGASGDSKAALSYREPEYGKLFYVENDRHRVTAQDQNGKILWSRQPATDGNLPPYSETHPRPNPAIVWIGALTQKDNDSLKSKGSGHFIGISFNSRQAGYLDTVNGDFIFAGQD